MSVDEKKSPPKVNSRPSDVTDTIGAPLIILWDKLEHWQRDNHFIRSGYRPASGSYKRSAWSLTYLHNETVNIFTHLLGALLFACGGYVLFATLENRYATASRDDVFAFSCFFAGAVACLSLSATYHTISNHSEHVHKFGNKLDYLGIVFLIWGSFVPSIYYGFTCDPNLITTYWAMITTIGAGCAVVTMTPRFGTPPWRPFRAGMFVAMGLSAIVPVLRGLSLYGTERLGKLISLSWLVTQGALYILGAGIYAARVPERWSPGRFDIWGSSHQIFHILVVAAAIVHLIGLIKAFDFNHSFQRHQICPVDPR